MIPATRCELVARLRSDDRLVRAAVIRWAVPVLGRRSRRRGLIVARRLRC